WPQSAGQINLSWSYPGSGGGQSGFVLERSPDGATGWTRIAGPSTLGASARAYSDSGLSSRTKYFYRVSATGSAGTSPPTPTASAVTVYTGVPLYSWLNVKTTNCGAQPLRPCAVGD